MFKLQIGNQLLLVDTQYHIEYKNIIITEINFKKNISMNEDNLVFVKKQGINSHLVAKLTERKDVTQA